MAFKLLQAMALLCLISDILCLSCIELQRESEKKCSTFDLRKSHSDNYIDCVKTRMKRHQTYCDNDDSYCYKCSCDSCSYNKCEGKCEPCCHSCCANYVECQTNHCCHEQCRYECGNRNCHRNCRESCYQSLQRNQYQDRTILIQQPAAQVSLPAANQRQDSAIINNNNLRNVTTVINMKHVINSTNVLNLPINMTSINKNNITVRELEQGGQDCCIVIGPKQCMPTQVSPYMRCFHTRSRQCGSYCSANIVHQETRQVCNTVNSYGRPTNCQQQVTYIPQPQPKCVYTSVWPYVSCGIQPPSSCEGCYQHYFNAQVKPKPCSPQCYDNFQVGPLYRQGPFYQPSYPQTPPCTYSPQGCGGFGSLPGYGLGSGMWPSIGSYGDIQFGQGFAAGNVGLNPFQAMGLPIQPVLDGFPNMSNSWNFTALNASFPQVGAAHQEKLVEEYQNDMPFVPDQEVQLRRHKGSKGQNDSDISVVRT